MEIYILMATNCQFIRAGLIHHFQGCLYQARKVEKIVLRFPMQSKSLVKHAAALCSSVNSNEICKFEPST
jgi:hypothetical protein